MLQDKLEIEIALSILCYSTCSISMILLNKLVIDTFEINFPMGLLFLQNSAAVLLISFLKLQGVVHYPDLDRRIAKRWILLTVLFVCMLWTSMKSLKIMSVAVQTILKNLAIILTALGDQYFYGKSINFATYGAFLLMIVGSYLGSVGDQWVTAWGLFWTFMNIFSTVAYVLYMKQLTKEFVDIGRYGPVFYNNVLSLPFLFPSCAATMPELWDALRAAGPGAFFCLSLMVLVGCVMTFATFWCMKLTSPTTYSVTGALNKIPLALFGVFIFGHVPTPVGWLGIAIALGGGMVYTWVNRPRELPSASEKA